MHTIELTDVHVLTPVIITWSPGDARRVTSPLAITVIERGMLPTGT